MGSSLLVAFTFFSPAAMTFPAGEVVAVGATVVVVAVVFTAAGASVVVELTTGDGATGDPVSAFDAGESPIPFTALMVTEYVVPLVRPLMVSGPVVVAGFSAM